MTEILEIPGFKYIPDEYLPCYILIKSINNEQNSSKTDESK
jgi:hypothetical protein